MAAYEKYIVGYSFVPHALLGCVIALSSLVYIERKRPIVIEHFLQPPTICWSLCQCIVAKRLIDLEW